MKWQSILTIPCLILVLEGNTLAQPAAQADVRAFVRGPLFPYSYAELASSYDTSVTPELIAMLDSDAEEDHWFRIAGMLGVVGDDRAADALIAFVEKPRPERVSDAVENARKEAIRALGFLVNRTGNERALTYLIDGLTPRVWRERNVRGTPHWMPSHAEYDVLLSTYALFGLALSGHPRAGEALRALQQSATPDQMGFREGLDDTLTQWLDVYDLVAERGVAGMYAEGQRREAQRLQEARQAQP